MNVLEAILAVQRDVTHVDKADQFNGGGTRYQYRGVDRVVQALAGSMRTHGLLMLPKCHSVPEWIPTTTAKGGASNVVRILVTYGLYTADDEEGMEVTVPGEAMDTGDKAVSKAMSVAWRTALIQTFNLPTGEPDPDSMNYELGNGSQPTPRTDADLAVYDEWQEHIRETPKERAAFVRLYNEAQASKAPQTVLKAILDAGRGLQ